MSSFEKYLMGTVWLRSWLWFDLGSSEMRWCDEAAAAPSCFECSTPFHVSLDHIQVAIAQLELLGALEHRDGQLTLTPMGRKMAAFPLEPKFAKVSATVFSVPSLYLTGQPSHRGRLSPVLPSSPFLLNSYQRLLCVEPRLTFCMIQAHVKSCVCACSVGRLSVTPWTEAHRLLCPWNFPGKNTGVGCHFLHQWSHVPYLYGIRQERQLSLLHKVK